MPRLPVDFVLDIRREFEDYRKSLGDIYSAREFHNRRNGLYEDDYVRPGISVEIPLFWGTF